MNRYDAIVLGAGVNGLLSAIYLAKAGRAVALVPGFQDGAVSYSEGWQAADGTIFPTYQNRTVDLGSDVFRELNLNSLRLPIMSEGGGMSFVEGREPLIRDADIANMAGRLNEGSGRDGNAYIDYLSYLDRIHRHASSGLKKDDPTSQGLTCETQEFLASSSNEILDRFFETEALRDHLAQSVCNSSLVPMGLGPFAPTTAYGLFKDPIFRQKGIRNTRVSVNGHLVRALIGMATSNGVLIQSGTEVEQLLIEKTRVKGVKLKNGISLQSACVISDLDASKTMSELIDWAEPSLGLADTSKPLRSRAGLAQINLTFDQSPALRQKYEPLAAMGPLYFQGTLENIEKSFDAWHAKKMPGRPPFELIFHPQVEVASDRMHASIYVSYVPMDLALGEWDDTRRFTLRTEILNAVSEWLPDFSNHLTHVETVTPDMFEERFAVSQGNLSGAEQSFDQWSVGVAEIPVTGLHFCGPGAPQFDFETGWSGRRAAHSVLSKKRGAQ
jgi:phytoene dehydrogenase-like protein